MKPTLLVLAAGMGSRYGSLKQMDGIGPNNEAIIDYSIYDAIRAGFGRVVFVIRQKSSAKSSRRSVSKGAFGSILFFRNWTICPKASPCPKGAKNRGERTTP